MSHKLLRKAYPHRKRWQNSSGIPLESHWQNQWINHWIPVEFQWNPAVKNVWHSTDLLEFHWFTSGNSSGMQQVPVEFQWYFLWHSTDLLESSLVNQWNFSRFHWNYHWSISGIPVDQWNARQFLSSGIPIKNCCIE